MHSHQLYIFQRIRTEVKALYRTMTMRLYPTATRMRGGEVDV